MKRSKTKQKSLSMRKRSPLRTKLKNQLQKSSSMQHKRKSSPKQGKKYAQFLDSGNQGSGIAEEKYEKEEPPTLDDIKILNVIFPFLNEEDLLDVLEYPDIAINILEIKNIKELDMQFSFLILFYGIYNSFIGTNIDKKFEKKLKVFFCIHPEILIEEFKNSLTINNEILLFHQKNPDFVETRRFDMQVDKKAKKDIDSIRDKTNLFSGLEKLGKIDHSWMTMVTELREELMEKDLALATKITNSYQRFQDYVKDYELIDTYSTVNSLVKPNKIYILDCSTDHLDNLKFKFQQLTNEFPVVFTTRNEVEPLSGLRYKLNIYGFEQKIENGFCHNHTASHLGFYMPCLKEIGDDWMCNCIYLNSVDFTGLKALKTVGKRWLKTCSAIITVNCTGLISLETIDDEWMFGCIRLLNVNLEDLKKLKKVENAWLGFCISLLHVNFQGLISLETVGHNWLKECLNLLSINCTDLTKLKEVGDFCLSLCQNLMKVNFKGLTSLEKVGKFWMAQCRNLSEIDGLDLINLKEVGESWLRSCENLREPNFVGYVSLKSVGDYWMCDCANLMGFHIEMFPMFTHRKGLQLLEHVGGYWMARTAIKTLRCSLPSLKTVGEAWMVQCSSLEKLYLDLQSLRSVGKMWLRNCSSLKNPNFTGMPKLKMVGDEWMVDCSQLHEPVFDGFDSLETIGKFFMAGCPSLSKNQNFSGMKSLQTIGQYWMYGARIEKITIPSSLKKIDLFTLRTIKIVHVKYPSKQLDFKKTYTDEIEYDTEKFIEEEIKQIVTTLLDVDKNIFKKRKFAQI
jgi:hypothetical protein